MKPIKYDYLALLTKVSTPIDHSLSVEDALGIDVSKLTTLEDLVFGDNNRNATFDDVATIILGGMRYSIALKDSLFTEANSKSYSEVIVHTITQLPQQLLYFIVQLSANTIREAKVRSAVKKSLGNISDEDLEKLKEIALKARETVEEIKNTATTKKVLEGE